MNARAEPHVETIIVGSGVAIDALGEALTSLHDACTTAMEQRDRPDLALVHHLQHAITRVGVAQKAVGDITRAAGRLMAALEEGS